MKKANQSEPAGQAAILNSLELSNIEVAEPKRLPKAQVPMAQAGEAAKPKSGFRIFAR